MKDIQINHLTGIPVTMAIQQEKLVLLILLFIIFF